jgi:RES domain-containing protein
VITAWRLLKKSLAKHAFDGEGARLFGGRWNSPGTRMVYCSATASLALLEVFANVQRPDFAAQFVLISCTFDESLVAQLDVKDLPTDWRSSPGPPELQQMGDAWIQDGETPILAVPSAIIEHEQNYLLNPQHAAFRRIKRARAKPFTFDLRLLRRK